MRDSEAMRVAEALIAVLPRRIPPPVDVPATAKAYNVASGVALVQVDGDSGLMWTPVRSLVGAVAAGDRVMVTFTHPHGIFLRTPPFA